MRFWILIIAGTVVISGGATWLWLHQGAQLDSSLETLSPATPKGQLEFDDVSMQANVIEIAPGDTKMNETKFITVPFHNSGTGPLKLQFVRASCKCVDKISVDDAQLTAGGNAIVKNAGEKGTLRIQWTPRKDSCQECDKKKLLIAVELWANDPRPQFASPFRFEILTRVAPDESAKVPEKS